MTVTQHKPQQSWSKDDKARAVGVYMVTGNQVRTSELTGIPQQTISYWLNNDDEFRALLERGIEEYSAELPIKIGAAMDKTLDVILKIINERDIDKISLSHAASTYNTLFANRQISMNRPTSISGKASEIEEQLERNAQALVASVKSIKAA